MTITSKPNDSDNIINRGPGLGGEPIYTPSKLLITFFDDIVNEMSGTNDLRKNIAILSSALARVSSLRIDLDSLENDVKTLNDDLGNTNQIVASFFAMIGAITTKQAELEQRINNLEQTGWR